MIANILVLVLGYTFYKAFLALWRVKFHPLAKFPGPRAAAVSNTWQCNSLKRGHSEAELEKLHQEYGTQALRVGPNEIHITDPSLYKTIYNQKSLYLKDHDFYAGFNVLSVFAMIDPEQHKERRRLLNPFFSKAGIFKTEGMIADKVSRLKKKIELLTAPRRNHPINASNAFRCLTIDIITHYAFSQSWMLIDKSDDSFHFPLLTALDAALEGIWDSIYKPILRKLMTTIPSSALSLVHKDVAKFLWLRTLGQDSYETYKNAEKNEEPSIFDALTAAVPEEKHIPDEALGLLIAGSDTTAFTLTFAIWHISRDFCVKQKLMKSLADSLPDREAPATLLQLEAIPYLSACIREALRLGTVSPGKLPRIVPCGSAEPLIVDGKVIPPGTIVSMSAYSMHRNKDIWGDDAREFNPDRWLGEDGKHLDTYLAPFSKGSRSCIGQNLAPAELFITLAMLYRHFDIKVDKISKNFTALDRFAPSVPEPGVILNIEKLD
ncbi:cytochrome P450 [Xylaria digitata]|nr:cytochrome P450 [Xylaria digitata]